MSAPPTDDVQDVAIAEAIRRLEELTSGEIRVFVSRRSPANAAREAQRQFEVLEMNRTPLRNAALLYFAPANRGFAVAMDEALHFRAGNAFAETIRAAMEPAWTEGRFHHAVLAAVEAAGVELSRHFPRSQLDRNDLANHVLRD
jgi:uncharacterized membrane protein